MEREKAAAGSPASTQPPNVNAGAKEEDIELVLTTLQSKSVIENSYLFAREHGRDHAYEITPALKKLEANSMVKTGDGIPFTLYELSEEAQGFLRNGSPEAVLWQCVPPEGILQSALATVLREQHGLDAELQKVAFSQAMKNKWIRLEKAAPAAAEKAAEAPGEKGKKKEAVDQRVFRQCPEIRDEVRELLQQVKKVIDSSVIVDVKQLPGAKDMETLKKRGGLVRLTQLKYYRIERGERFGSKLRALAAELTYEMMLDGSWEEMSFKPVNLNALGKEIEGGHLHPLLKMRSEMREILLRMGFEEMPTDQFVESAFWNFDALYQPQQHPARDAHDTFFIKDPPTAVQLPAEYMAKVKASHEHGIGEGSLGWRYEWSEAEARKNILRTHTTAVSARMLYRLARDGFHPCKYFSIDRVFRNEAMDATHLCEFHQIEGVICDRGLTLADLIGTIKLFYEKLGFDQRLLRFKPAYNPYTEPSMEIFGLHPILKRWVEIGNSGVFRPEMLAPLGLPKDVSVIAWGLGLERPAMIREGCANIRELLGDAVRIRDIETSPICRLDKPRQRARETAN